jgi:HlyD family secretion protein
MSKTKILVIIILLLAGLGYLFFHHTRKAPPPPTVVVQRGDIAEKAEAIGYIKPKHSNIVKSQINGTIAEIYHFEGEFVKKGTPLLKVNPTPSPEQYATAHQDAADTSAQEKSAYYDLQRFEVALKNGLISANYTDYINAKKTYDVSKIRHELAVQKLDLLEKGKTNVSGKAIANIVESPVDGFILNRNVDVGDPVISLSSAQASTALFSVADMSDLMFEGYVDEMDAAKIVTGMESEIIVGSMPEKPIIGKLTHIALQSEKENKNQISSTADTPFNVSFKVEITELKIPEDIILRSGYSATANIAIKKVKNSLLLPLRVVQFQNGNPYVLIPGAAKEPEHKMIKVGISDGVNIEILSGLKEKDSVLDRVETMAGEED